MTLNHIDNNISISPYLTCTKHLSFFFTAALSVPLHLFVFIKDVSAFC